MTKDELPDEQAKWDREDDAYMRACLLTEMRIVAQILQHAHTSSDQDVSDVQFAHTYVQDVIARAEQELNEVLNEG
jgi:hypothetical protein